MARPRKDQSLDIPSRAVAETLRLLHAHAAADISLAMVAAAVGCRPPALYTHFRNRDALLRTVHDAGFQHLLDTKRAVAARTEGDPLARLRQGGLAYLRFARENPGLYRLMFDPPPLAALDGNPFARDPGRQALHVLRDSVAACQGAGVLPNADPDIVAFTLWSLVHGMASLLLLDRAPATGQDPETLGERGIDQVMALIGAISVPPHAAEP